MKRDVRKGIMLRHSLVEKALDKVAEAHKQAYLCHLDRAELLVEIDRLNKELTDERQDRREEQRRFSEPEAA